MRINIPDRTWKRGNPTNKPVFRILRGVNKLDPFSISPEFAHDEKNLSTGEFPAASIRPGITLLGGTGFKVLGLTVWKDSELHAVFGDGTWRKWSGTAWTTIKSGLNTIAEWSFVNFKGDQGDVTLFGANGVDPVQRYNGTTIAAMTTAPAGANYIDQHDNRLYCAVGNQLYFAPISISDNWNLVQGNDSDGGKIVRETNDGQYICGLKSGAGHVTVFFPDSSHELYGTSAADFMFNLIADDIGGLNNQCIVTLKGRMYFGDETGIYEYSGSRPRSEFSERVNWYMRNMNKAAKQTSCMGTDGRYLYVAIPMVANTPDTILVYDSTEDDWHVWKDLSPLKFVKFHGELYYGDASGTVYKLGGTTDNGTAIAWERVFCPFTAESLSSRVRLPRLNLVLDKPAGSTLEAFVSNDPSGNSGWVSVASLTAPMNLQSKTILLKPATLGLSNWIWLRLAGVGPMTLREVNIQEVTVEV